MGNAFAFRADFPDLTTRFAKGLSAVNTLDYLHTTASYEILFIFTPVL
jgi:hypothetical protein